MKSLLEVRGLSKVFGGLTAINDLDFHIAEGELFSVIGPNGAGKTTLFNLISGFLPPTKGTISFRGQDVTNLRPDVIASKGIGRIFQRTTLFPRETVLNNLLIAHGLRVKTNLWDAIVHSPRFRQGERACLEKAVQVLSLIGLEGSETKPAGNISQEAQKRLSIGIALATEPKLLLLDEPTGGVNLQEIGGLTSLIERIRDLGITVCLIEHKMRIVMDISDRIIALNYGCKIAEGSPGEVGQDKGVIEAYLGEGYVA